MMPDVYQSVFDQVENETAKIGLEMIGTCIKLTTSFIISLGPFSYGNGFPS